MFTSYQLLHSPPSGRRAKYLFIFIFTFIFEFVQGGPGLDGPRGIVGSPGETVSAIP